MQINDVIYWRVSLVSSNSDTSFSDTPFNPTAVVQPMQERCEREKRGLGAEWATYRRLYNTPLLYPSAIDCTIA